MSVSGGAVRDAGPEGGRTGDWSTGRRLVVSLLWAVVLVAVLSRVVSAVAGWSRGGWDLWIVHLAGRDFLHGAPVYDDPYFLYAPSSALLAAPFGVLGQHTVLVLGTIGVACTLTWLCLGSVRLLAGDASPWLAPAALLVLLVSRPGSELFQTLNVEFVALAALPLLYRWAADGRWTAFGVLLGLTIAVKPILLALVLLPLLARNWRAVAWAVGVPAGLSVVGLLLMPGTFAVVPEMMAQALGGSAAAAQGGNMSLAGVFGSFDVSGPLVLLGRAAVVAVGIAAVVVRWRRGGDPVERVVHTGTLALLTSILAASLAWDHYLGCLVPLFVVAARSAAAARAAWPVWACTVPLLTVLLPLPAVPVGPFTYGARAGLGVLVTFAVLALLALRTAPQPRSAAAGRPADSRGVAAERH